MVRSRSKYSRARIRARARRPKRRGGARWYYGALAAIVAAGTAGIVLSAGASDTPPLPGIDPATGTFYDHWHSALAVNVCGQWLQAPAEFSQVADSNVQAGIHTHGDGFIHIHPHTAADAGENATLGRFFDNGGWQLSRTSMTLWADQTRETDSLGRETWENGDECPEGTEMAGREGIVQWSVNCRPRSGNPAGYELADLEVVALGFLPEDERIGVPPNAAATYEADPGEMAEALDVDSCATAGPGGELVPPTTAPPTTTPPATTP